MVYLAVTDPNFRAKLLEDPKAAIASTGLRLDADELAAISELRHLITLPASALVATVWAFNPNWKWN